MKKLIVGICLLGCLCACNGGKKSTDTTDVQMELVDSIETAADTLWIEEVEEELTLFLDKDKKLLK